MGLIPDCVTDRQLERMSDTNFERLVVAPGERLCADIIAMCAEWRAENQAFLDECYGGITIEQARKRWNTPASREIIQATYAEWRAKRPEKAE